MRLTNVVLVVDDQPDNFEVIETLLYGEGYELIYLADARQTLAFVDSFLPDIILLDMMMPHLSGIEVCRQLKSHPQWRFIPVIMVTALNSKEELANCLRAGAHDFISKPLDSLELRSRVKSALQLYQQYHQIQQLNQELELFNTALDEQVKERTAQLEQFSFYDPLTHLPSRVLLSKLIAQSLEKSASQPFALICLNCDQFKLINASLGHKTGNQLLIAIAERLGRFLNQDAGQLAHLGSDEFCLLLHNIDNPDKASELAREILASFNTPFEIDIDKDKDKIEIYVSVCLGITLVQDQSRLPESLLQEAGTAMHHAKSQGKGIYQIFEKQMHNAALGRLRLEQDMQRALKQNEFAVWYQPILDLKQEQLVGFEALVRWHHPERGMVSPAEFIPCAEETGLIVPIGLFVLRKSCEQLSAWQEHYPHPLFVSVNLSVRQFSHPSLVRDVVQILLETAISPEDLKLEITESAIMENPETAITLTKELRSRKIQLSIDDFGTGYSSLSYLSRFPVDSIKIDRSFVDSIDAANNVQIVQAIITLGHALGMVLIAEGIENAEQADHLRQLGCEYGQGYFFHRPLPPDQATALLLTESPSSGN